MRSRPMGFAHAPHPVPRAAHRGASRGLHGLIKASRLRHSRRVVASPFPSSLISPRFGAARVEGIHNPLPASRLPFPLHTWGLRRPCISGLRERSEQKQRPGEESAQKLVPSSEEQRALRSHRLPLSFLFPRVSPASRVLGSLGPWVLGWIQHVTPSDPRMPWLSHNEAGAFRVSYLFYVLSCSSPNLCHMQHTSPEPAVLTPFVPSLSLHLLLLVASTGVRPRKERPRGGRPPGLCRLAAPGG